VIVVEVELLVEEPVDTTARTEAAAHLVTIGATVNTAAPGAGRGALVVVTAGFERRRAGICGE